MPSTLVWVVVIGASYGLMMAIGAVLGVLVRWMRRRGTVFTYGYDPRDNSVLLEYRRPVDGRVTFRKEAAGGKDVVAPLRGDFAGNEKGTGRQTYIVNRWTGKVMRPVPVLDDAGAPALVDSPVEDAEAVPSFTLEEVDGAYLAAALGDIRAQQVRENEDEDWRTSLVKYTPVMLAILGFLVLATLIIVILVLRGMQRSGAGAAAGAG